MVEKKKQSTSESRHILGVHPTGKREVPYILRLKPEVLRRNT